MSAPTGIGAGAGKASTGAALEVVRRAYVLENGQITLRGTAVQLADDPRVRAAYLGV